MTAAPMNRSESSPRETATTTAETQSSPTRISPYLVCYPQAETDEQHIDPQDASDDEYEDIEHGLPQRLTNHGPQFVVGRTSPSTVPPSRPARQKVCAQGCERNPCKYALRHGTGAPDAVRCSHEHSDEGHGDLNLWCLTPQGPAASGIHTYDRLRSRSTFLSPELASGPNVATLQRSKAPIPSRVRADDRSAVHLMRDTWQGHALRRMPIRAEHRPRQLDPPGIRLTLAAPVRAQAPPRPVLRAPPSGMPARVRRR